MIVETISNPLSGPTYRAFFREIMKILIDRLFRQHLLHEFEKDWLCGKPVGGKVFRAHPDERWLLKDRRPSLAKTVRYDPAPESQGSNRVKRKPGDRRRETAQCAHT